MSDEMLLHLLRRSLPWFLGVGATIVAGCGTQRPTQHIDLPWGDSQDAPIVLLVGVVDLRASDLDAGRLPRLTSTLANAHRFTDVLSSGAGATAALAFVTGREPLDELRRPQDPLGWARSQGWDVQVLHVAPTLSTQPEMGRWEELVRAGGRDAFAPPAFGPHPTLAVDLVDPFAAPAPPLRPSGREDRDEVLAEFDRRLDSWLRGLLDSEDGARLHVWIAGIPRAPDRYLRSGMGWSPSETLDRMRVPLALLRKSGEAEQTALPVAPQDAVGALRGFDRPDRRARHALWWNEFGGGALVLRDHRVLLVDDRERTLLFDTRRRPLERVELAATEPDTVEALLDALARDTIGDAPRLWAAVRGSDAVDFVDLRIVAARDSLHFEPWGLEAIDGVDTLRAAHVELHLAAEPQADGVLVDLGWPPRPLELRLTPWLEDSPLVGNLVDLGAGRHRLHAVRLAPWSRPFWEATSAWPIEAETWWPRARPGLHVRIGPRTKVAPVPAPLD